METTRRAPAGILPILVLLVTACGGGADQAVAQAVPRNACELLPVADVEAIVGRKVQVEDLGRIPTEQWSACGWLDPEDGVPWLEVQVTWSGGKAKAKAEAAGGDRTLKPIDGFGDGAWLSTNPGQRSLLLVGDVLVELHTAMLPGVSAQMMTGKDAEHRAQFEKLARAIRSRL
jgi:hypothetical protein